MPGRAGRPGRVCGAVIVSDLVSPLAPPSRVSCACDPQSLSAAESESEASRAEISCCAHGPVEKKKSFFFLRAARDVAEPFSMFYVAEPFSMFYVAEPLSMFYVKH